MKMKISKFVFLTVGALWVCFYFWLYFIRPRTTRLITPLTFENPYDYVWLGINILLFLLVFWALIMAIRSILNRPPGKLSAVLGKLAYYIYSKPLSSLVEYILEHVPYFTDVIMFRIGRRLRSLDEWLTRNAFAVKWLRFNYYFTRHTVLLFFLNILPRGLLCLCVSISVLVFSAFNYFLIPIIILATFLFAVRVLVGLLDGWTDFEIRRWKQFFKPYDPKYEEYDPETFTTYYHVEVADGWRDAFTGHPNEWDQAARYWVHFLACLLILFKYQTEKTRPYAVYFSTFLLSIYCIVSGKICLIRLGYIFPDWVYFVPVLICVIIYISALIYTYKIKKDKENEK